MSKRVNTKLAVQCTDDENGDSEQESDENRPQGDLPSGACAASGAGESDATNEQLKTVRAKAHQQYTAHKSEQTVEEPVQASDGQQLVFGVQTQTVYAQRRHADHIASKAATSTQEANLSEGMTNVSLEEKTNSSRKSANEEKCKKKLSDMEYNSRKTLAQLLDPNSNGIDDLMPQLLKSDDCKDVWMACHGGTDPAMGLIYTLGKSKLTTLEQFRKYARKAEPEDSKTLLDIIDDYTKNMREDGKDTVMKTRLDNLEYELINTIAKEISAKKYPVAQQKAPLWKSIAGEAHVKMASITCLDMPAIRASQCESMTMKFLEVVNQRCPSKTIAWLANGLMAIGRNDVFVKLASFDDSCFDKDGKHTCE